MTSAEAGLKRYPSEQSPWHWKFLGVKAQVWVVQGRLNESLSLFNRPLPEQFQDSDFAVRLKLSQALSLAATQRVQEADALISHAQALAASLHPELLGEVALRKGTVCFIAGDFACAGSAYRTALQGARKHHDPYFEAAALNGLAIVSTKLQRYDEAIEWNRAALQVAETAGARYSLAQILGNTAWCYRKLGDYENALDLYNRARDASNKFGIAGDQIYWLTGISNVFYEQQDYPAAEAVLLQGLDLARRNDDKSTLLEYFIDLAEIALQTGRAQVAESYYREASAIQPADHSEVTELILVKAGIEDAMHDYASAKASLKQLVSDPGADSSQRWEAQAHLARIYAEEGAEEKADREFRRALENIEHVRASVRAEELRVSFLSSVVSLYDDYIGFLVDRRRERDALRVADLSRARTLADGLGKGANLTAFSTGSFHPEQLARQLNSILLFYWVGPEHSYLWVISPVKVSCLPLPKRSDINPVLKNYRRRVLDGIDVLTSDRASGEQLYKMFVAPAERFIPRDSRVVLLPSENQYGLNFEALVVPGPDPHYWIEDVTLSTASSLTLLEGAGRTAPTGTKSLLLMGNSQAPNEDFPSLLQGKVEMEKVSAHFSPQERMVLEGKQATPAAYLKSDPQRFAYLHFVTHGTASLMRPLESAVILSRDGESYKLYARDIVSLPLSARLVTISACNGAGTRAYTGEGLVGLSWAFLRAGAHNVIASLWEVSDAASTAVLMDKLYEGLDKGQDPATALRNAKLFVLKSNPGTVFRKPFYWAPFQLYIGY